VNLASAAKRALYSLDAAPPPRLRSPWGGVAVAQDESLMMSRTRPPS
jgi:hypothetical protein